ncbi:hypothetical protein A2U01_0078577 [Trifolium medium]|uniref:Uncharacterized protein n=1 Tax=Trifolium medium TaxID=97028 RepID=A0A392TB30_9FABA|nr:hypothetical protein [Trifolium medium]
MSIENSTSLSGGKSKISSGNTSVNSRTTGNASTSFFYSILNEANITNTSSCAFNDLVTSRQHISFEHNSCSGLGNNTVFLQQLI